MERILSNEIASHCDERILIAGWLHRQRELSRVTFLLVRDRNGITQVVMSAERARELASLPEESVIEVIGTVVANPQAPNGYELIDPDVRLISSRPHPLPFELFRPEMTTGLPTMLDHASVALRHPRQRAAFQIMAASLSGFRSTLDGLSFTEIQTPKIVGSATESGANVFAIDYFGRQAYLAQSPQFYKQAMVGVFERVYEVGPVFRAEPHDTTRHLAEYVSLDAELGFIADHTTVMAVLTTVLRGMLSEVADRAGSALSIAGITLPQVHEEIPTLHFADAQAMISRATGENLVGKPDLAPAHERWLGEWALREHNSEFVFVTGYPMAKRPFYTQPEPNNPEFSNSFDLLFKGVELVTGGQRLHEYGAYVKALQSRGQLVEDYESYLQPFKYGMPPHGGFAIGLERWVARLTGAQNVRETTLFPRDRNRLTP